jgi:predicted nucleic acid-binding protein
VELYGLLRNPAVLADPLPAHAAVKLVQALREHPRWELVDYPGGLMTEVWSHAAAPGFARRRVYDTRLALTLRHHGVTEFATANVKDFQGFGFTRVWNPLSAAAT